MTPATFFLILTGVLLNAVAQLFLKAGTTRTGVIELSAGKLLPTAVTVATNPWMLGGIACYAVSVFIWIAALSRAPVSVAYPMLSIGYIVNAVAAWMLFGEALTLTKLLGIGIIVLGVFILARA